MPDVQAGIDRVARLPGTELQRHATRRGARERRVGLGQHVVQDRRAHLGIAVDDVERDPVAVRPLADRVVRDQRAHEAVAVGIDEDAVALDRARAGDAGRADRVVVDRRVDVGDLLIGHAADVPTAIAPMHEFWMLLFVTVASRLDPPTTLPPWETTIPPPRMLSAQVGPPPAAAGEVIVALLIVTSLSVVLSASALC